MVVANDAKDWSADGAANLANADWECYVPDAGQADADYDAPNLEIVYNLENQRRLGPGFFGGGLVLAKLPEGMTPSQFAANSDNFMTEPNKVDATQLYFMLPSEYLLDAVEMYDATEAPIITRCWLATTPDSPLSRDSRARASAARLPKSREDAPTIRTPTTRRTIS